MAASTGIAYFTIPPAVQQCLLLRRLTSLDISNTAIFELPEAVGQLTALQALDMHNDEPSRVRL